MRIRKVTIANMKMASIQSSEVRILGTMIQVLFHLEQFRYVGSSRNLSLLNNWKSDMFGLMLLYNFAEKSKSMVSIFDSANAENNKEIRVFGI